MITVSPGVEGDDGEKVRKVFLEEVTSELNLQGKRNHYAEAHLCNSMVSEQVSDCGRESMCVCVHA